MQVMKSFARDERGLVLLEWVAIAAVVFIAAFAISAMVLQSADGLGGSVADQMDAAADSVNGGEE